MSVATPKQNNNPLFHAMVEAGVQAGYPRTDDLNGYQQEGFGPMDRTVTPQGRRASTARGYLDQARGRPNLTIRTHALTDHIILPVSARLGSNGWRATAPRRQKRRPVKKYCCAREPSLHRRSCNVPVSATRICYASLISRWFTPCPASAKPAGPSRDVSAV